MSETVTRLPHAMTSTFLVRRCRAEDAIEIENLHIAILPIRYDKSFYRQLMTGVEDRFCFVAERRRDKQLVGVVTARRTPRGTGWFRRVFGCNCAKDKADSDDLRTNRDAYIMSIGVLSECRRRGLGQRLLSACLDRLRHEGGRCPSSSVGLHVLTRNHSALRLYSKNGFVIRRKLIDHYFFQNAFHDAYFLSKELTSRRSSDATPSSSVFSRLYRSIQSAVESGLSININHIAIQFPRATENSSELPDVTVPLV